MKYNILFLIFVVTNSCASVLGKLSGLYVDNGLHQSVMAQTLTDDDKLEVEQEILELLELPIRPRNHHAHPSLRKSAPKFLLDVYKRLNEEENGNRTTRDVSDFNNFLSLDDEQAIDQSDIIMTFLNKNHHVSEVRHERGCRLWFDVSKVSKELFLTQAELRLRKLPSQNTKWSKNKVFQITVYSIIKADGQREIEMLATINTTANYQGWLELNVTSALGKWIKEENSNKGFYIGAHSLDKPEHEVKLENIGIVNAKGEDEPFMVGFFNGVQIIHSHTLSRSKRNTNTTPKKRYRKDKNIVNDWRPENHKTCQIQTLYVSFQDLDWHDWIIAPNGFHAHYCSGECNFPLNAPTNPTNHAIVQTLVHLVSPTKVPKPCCVPTKLGAISVLYYLDDSNVVVKKYRNIVVKSCGCH